MSKLASNGYYKSTLMKYMLMAHEEQSIFNIQQQIKKEVNSGVNRTVRS